MIILTTHLDIKISKKSTDYLITLSIHTKKESQSEDQDSFIYL